MNTSLERPTAGAGFLSQAAVRAGRVLGRADLLVRRIPQPPTWLVLGVLVVAGWGISAESSRVALHNGWLYSNGGDDTWYYTSAWAIAHGHLPLASIGYGYPLLIAPFALIAGPNLLRGLPWIVVFNQLVLAPIALVSIYGIVRMFASRWYAYLTTLLWVISPVLVIHYFLADYHERYVDTTLPSEVGLTPLGDFPSMVALLVAAYFILRHIQTRADIDAVAAGLATGLAIAIKPANALFLVAVVGTLLVGRRPRGLGMLALALLPALVGIAFWKYRGLGHLPVFTSAAPLALAMPLVGHLDLSRYFPFHWSQLHHNLDGLREYTWSQRLIYFTVGGGLIGLARRSLPAATLAGLWLGAFVVDKGSSAAVDMLFGSFFTHLIAAFPAYFLLVVSVPYLVPVYGSRRRPSPLGVATRRRLPKTACAILGTILVVGLLAVAVLPKLSTSDAAELPLIDLYVPMNGFPITAHAQGGAVTLNWASQHPAGTRASYGIFRMPASSPVCGPATLGSAQCPFNGVQIGSVDTGLGRHDTYVTTYTDHPPAGNWTYRVMLSATPYGPPQVSDYTLLSRPVTVRVQAHAAGK